MDNAKGGINSLERECLDIIHGKECFSRKDLCNYLGDFLLSGVTTILSFSQLSFLPSSIGVGGYIVFLEV